VSKPPITLNQLQELATRTAPDQGAQHFFCCPTVEHYEFSELDEQHKLHEQRVDLIHAALGMAGEAGEVVDLLKKSMYYGKPLDVEKVKEEAGDLLWYIASVMCRALDCTLEELAMYNVDKLRARYPEKYTDQAAIARVDVAPKA
jgi:NTP pyrophosphatase (non-canonical NTP hydrolase)